MHVVIENILVSLVDTYENVLLYLFNRKNEIS